MKWDETCSKTNDAQSNLEFGWLQVGYEQATATTMSFPQKTFLETFLLKLFCGAAFLTVYLLLEADAFSLNN